MDIRADRLKRTFQILTLAPLALSTLPGCGILSDPLIGEWEITKVSYEGETYELSYSYTEDGCTYSYSIDLTLEFDEKDGDEFEGKFEMGYSYSYTCESESTQESESYSYDAEAEKTGRKEYEIKIDDWDEEWDCEIEEDELKCSYDGVKFTFEKTD